MKDIVIIGAGGFGREVLWLIQDINKITPKWNILGFVDDLHPTNEQINGYPVIGNIEWLKTQNINVICAIGDPITKKKVLNKVANSENKYPVLIHPSVICSILNTVGEGSIICAGSILTVNITVGKHVIINLDCTVGHDAIIGDYSTILPSVNISGHATIENCVSIGTGSKIIQGVNIGKNTIIGAGAVVTKDIPENVVAVGIPAKSIKTREIQEELE